MRIILSLFLLFISTFVKAQLVPIHIPADNDSICEYPVSPDPIIDTVQSQNFANAGFMVGDTVLPFKLYDLYGDSMEIETAFNKGKPVLLISGSYTCPIFRGKIADINAIAASYSSSIVMALVYVIEPHPDIDVSPYSGTVWTHSDNYTENILYRQPLTYGERKAIVSDMINNYTSIDIPIVIDGPCNDWWLTYGPAPNMAYLITTEGVVYTKHGWFNKAPNNMSDDIDSLLGTASVSSSPNSSFVNLSVYTSSDVITFSLEGNDHIESISVFDLMGREVMKVNYENKRISHLNMEILSKGIYTYLVSTHTQLLSGKLIK